LRSAFHQLPFLPFWPIFQKTVSPTPMFLLLATRISRMRTGITIGFTILLMMKSSLLFAHSLRIYLRALALPTKMEMQTVFFSLLSKS
jgi:hypothetical protein